ncbi:MAG: hypothetical protein MJ090_05830 [Clostridia bacterium]|nr:hypothetical protein [Clostridia bacterium]
MELTETAPLLFVSEKYHANFLYKRIIPQNERISKQKSTCRISAGAKN